MPVIAWIGGVHIFIVYGLFGDIIKQAVKEGLEQAVDGSRGLAGDIARRAVDGVMDVGKQELARGVERVSKAMSLERLKQDPGRLAAEITRLAGENRGDLTAGQVMSHFQMDRASATRALDGLAGSGICAAASRDGILIYRFPAFKARKKIKLCQFCGNRYEPEDTPGSDCPSCGAPLDESSVIVD
jgi:hypothetical protein